MQEIHESYAKLAEVLDPEHGNTDPEGKHFFNDIKIAFTTLSNPQSRAEYDDYMNTCL